MKKVLTSARKDVGRDRVVFLGGLGHYLGLVLFVHLFCKFLDVIAKNVFFSSIQL